MVALTYPGVYIQEVPSGVRTITGVSTSTALFVGRSERGVMYKPTRLFSYTDFVRKFGGRTVVGEMATSVRLFFANGGTQAIIMRIANNQEPAEVTLKNTATVPADVLTIKAREDGLVGGTLRVAVDYNTPTPDSSFNLRVFRVDPTSLVESEVEFHANLTMEQSTARYFADVLAQNSAHVTAEIEPGLTAQAGYSIGARLIGGTGTLAEIFGVVPDNSPLRLEVDGDIYNVVVHGGDINTALDDLPVESDVVGFDSGTKFAVRIKHTGTGTVRVLPSGLPSDVATLLQMGPVNGGIEATPLAHHRPAPSGILANGYTNLDEIASLEQEDYDGDLNITVGGVELTGFNLATTGVKFYDGPAWNTSLRNVRQKLDMLAQQFNAKAQNLVNFNWRLEVQGFLLVFRPISGDANQGLGTLPESTPLAFLDDALGFVRKSNNVRYYTLGSSGAGAFQSGADGDDGTPPYAPEYRDAYEVIDREVDIFNLMVLPRDASHDEESRTGLWADAAAFCLRRRAFLLVDPPAGWATVDDITNANYNISHLRTGLVKDHCGLFWPRLVAVDENGLRKPVDPSGAIAGVMARTDGNRGVWKAPAGLEADIRGIVGVERQVSDPENGITNPLGVNTIRVFPNGIVSWGARTMDGFDNSGNSDYKYVPVRRLALFLAESLRRGLQFAVFEPNDEPLWAQIRLAAGAFMHGLFRQGAFQGQKKSDAYFVKVDAETTTQNDINLGIVNVVVGFAPLKPAEFVVVQLKQIAGQIQT